MKAVFDDSKPIFQQIADMIADDIVEGHLKEGDQIPSTTEISQFYQINRATAQKGLATLVNEGLVYKQRGVGMFVANGATATLMKQRKEHFYKQYVKPMLNEAKRIHLTEEELIQFIKEDKDA
ncbi:GntR family transcriptional regulator [Alkalihalobacillus alcalophilus ATCC 27647 = CGMCC 1.3604]|uniref:GntR family transcriptional regulator n=1 Tax=Alkalihalobacillus alcalophilus ATCC 27647 = CGMCC 1.3604 TaxID=1218173 RepID=A0A094WJJ9_ALKAL|nr:GntR family transcriptional regulator [Alkalihalobacillus alcalophilus]KGA96123.1 GntR family transcriptional regulator [Alkalihalobacillus alcalophilus ATCC 27647 = CGMCC 1.3604]MED1564313.1 GntR family transcriptional regulator [Alkalihalobacillus alcalophilus]THG92074.1 GntR family transcriptional regulator [Alkalihalobacillus alcalophilus ATCC 27647 = CGMCC 1.3604]